MSKRANKISRIPPLDLSHLNAATILARQDEDETITIILVGCGGTGSYMAQHIGRILLVLNERGAPARGIFVDHDHVERKNIGRQLFCEAELGRNKAEALAFRYGTAWGLDIAALPARFIPSVFNLRGNDLTVLVGCVDNAAARKEIAHALIFNQSGGHAPGIWWLDCGNHAEAGQVLLGSAIAPEQMKNAFPSPQICQALPAPSVQQPELLIPKPEETSASKMSCAELTAANLQSLNINSRIAAEAADMLTRLLVTRNLKRFACELNLSAGSMKSTYVTPEEVARVINKPVGYVQANNQRGSVAA
jgi:PRTRC genetic system ThiF family protein